MFDELCDIVAPIASKHGICRVYLFGSRARGDNNENSDFDFCVVTSEDCGLMRLGAFLYDLEDALGNKVDILCEEAMNTDLAEVVLRDRRLVFEA
ncbi:MAG: nucleotidyltransferase domain-containing protein [Candidatus Methanoplasma sp.]|nr:nucleotidyltransferase domain-containing protein [Candidatus Methanoplasma sp.]